ncbi:tail fiber domain-containing protein [uncultured Psychroserpens sp.]|uniref:tail fiber domain-containing protein n=1 Tax=uncultured Psychroserpens sp. TaxID=255436 RepID=UPI0026037DF5|nr:tail fiber domain-containing protein [uncultured Psychroserpens sp.]
MKTRFLFILLLYVYAIGIAQNGINYKALVKDSNGNVLSNQNIDIQFTILEGATTVYEEIHTITTDQNGLIVTNIGDGSILSGTFSSIDWNQNIQLNTQIDIEQDGSFVDLGSEPFNYVPRAFYAEKAQSAQTAVIAQSAANVSIVPVGQGLGLAGTNNNVGSSALDLTFFNEANSGATGSQSFAVGRNANAADVFAIAMGFDTKALGSSSVAIGNDAVANVNSSFSIGISTIANSLYATALGRLNVGYSNAIFEIGNGTGNSVTGFNRSNIFTIFKNGNVIIDGNLGINTNAPLSKIHIPQGNDTGLGNNNGFILLGETNGANISIDNNEIMARNNGNAADLNLQIEGGRVLIGGNVGIGTTNPEELLHIEGIVRIGTETIEDTGLNRLSFDASLLPNVNNSTDLGAADFRWNTVYATNGSINTSDRREKKNIKNLNYGLHEVLQMQPVSFNWKDKNNPDAKIGLIAQDLLKLIPEVVKTHTWETTSGENSTLKKVELDRLGVYYSDLIPVLINAIKEQHKEIEDLKKALKTQKSLEERISSLEQKITN